MIQNKKIINIYKTSKNFKNIREKNNLTQSDLSVALKGVPVSLIDDIEQGRFIPTLEYVFDFCEYFSVSIDEVISSNL